MTDDDLITSPRVAQLASQHLTKSRYIAGVQCLRRLWLLVNEPEPYEEPAPGSPMDVGQEIGRKAHLLFPGGALIDEEPWRHAQAVAQTAVELLVHKWCSAPAYLQHLAPPCAPPPIGGQDARLRANGLGVPISR
jgi:hypothetical protein